MRRLPTQPRSTTGHRRKWTVRTTLGLGAVGGLVAIAPSVSAAPVEHAADDPHVRAEMVDIVTESLRSARTSGALDDLAGPSSQVSSCLLDVAATQPISSMDDGAIAPCVGALHDVDPTALPRLLASLKVSKLTTTLVAAKTPHDPAVPHWPNSRTTPTSPEDLPSTELTPDTSETIPTDESTPTDDVTPDEDPDSDSSSGTSTTGSAKYVTPTSGSITSPFGDGRGHQGIDIANSIGTPIVAVADGEVISAGPAQGFGLWVRLRHADGTVTTYGHNNNNAVSVGQRVRAGQKIATVGNRGQSTGPHLHFEVTSPSGKKVDPVKWLDDRGAGVTDDADTDDADTDDADMDS